MTIPPASRPVHPPAHPNGCDRLDGVFVLAPHPAGVAAQAAARLAAIWGAVAEQPGGLRVAAGATALHMLDEAALRQRFPAMRLPAGAARRAPLVVALSLHTADFTASVIAAMTVAGVRVEEGAVRRVLVPPAHAGGVILEIQG
jgi:hypothetical protein